MRGMWHDLLGHLELLLVLLLELLALLRGRIARPIGYRRG